MPCLGGAYPSSYLCVQYTGQGFTDNTDVHLFVAGEQDGQAVEWESFVHANINEYDVFIWKLPYLRGISPYAWAWDDFNQTRELYFRLAQQYPDKDFIMVTEPLGGSRSYPGIEQYNAAMRNWYAQHGQDVGTPRNIWYFDIAEFESTQRDARTRCLDSGGEYVCLEHRNPADTSGHIIQAGGEWIARGFWVLLARIENSR